MKKASIFLPVLFLAFFTGNSDPLNKNLLIRNNNTPAKTGLLNNISSSFAMMRMNMYAISSNGAFFLVDGTLTQYDDDFSNIVDGSDARKLTNPGENIGMLRDNKTLIIESRQTISQADTIFFKMWGMQKRSYQMQFIGTNLNRPGLQGFLEDTYLKISTPIGLDDTTKVTFTVNNDTASASMYRFRLVFNTVTMVALPFVFTNVNGYWRNNQTIVKWETKNEKNLSQYTVERSVDGQRFFVPVHAQNSSTGTYQWLDENPATGNNYYRIHSIGIDGTSEYSKVIAVFVDKSSESFTVYPNPAKVDNFNLQLNNQEAGLYEVQLINTFGQTLVTRTFNHSGGSGNQKINFGRSIPQGIYQLQVKSPRGEKKLISVVF